MYSDLVLITGGTGAIGKALCSEFQAAGQCVVATCHPSDLARSEEVIAGLQRSGAIVVLLPFDVTDTDACQQAIEEIETRIGSITIAVNAAGITRDAALRNLEPEDWGAVLRTNLDSVYNICRPVSNVMSERGYGRIINISSVNGQRGQIPGILHTQRNTPSQAFYDFYSQVLSAISKRLPLHTAHTSSAVQSALA